MKRLIDNHLINWKKDTGRKPLILRGARQVGKTTAVRTLAQSFAHYIELDLESRRDLHVAFSDNLDPKEIISNLQLLIQKTITPKNTLLFLDEIQACPRAILALRYFYEAMPELHVIAAGSLLDFAIEQVGVPVGRVQFMRLYPMSFQEFLMATDNHFLLENIVAHDVAKPFSAVAHQQGLKLLGEYIAIGGMPEAVKRWRDTKNYVSCLEVHHDLITAYKQDFEKYARKSQIKYVDLIFSKIPLQLGAQFQYKKIGSDYRKRELEPALLLLKKANVITPIQKITAMGLPLASHANPEYFKLNMIDVALTQAILGLTSEQWVFDLETAFANKGAIAESFVGQELLSYDNPRQENNLYYWQRHQHGSEAEVDYIISQEGKIIPIEVKSGKGSTLKSMHLFLDDNPRTPFGIRFSTQNFSEYGKIKSYPLYAVMKLTRKNYE